MLPENVAPLAEFLDRYHDCSRHTLRAYGREVRRFALWVEWAHGLPVTQCADKALINQYREVLSQGGVALNEDFLAGAPQPFATPGVPLQAGSVQQAMRILGLFFEFLVDAGYLARNPAKLARKVRRQSQQNLLPRDAFTRDEWHYCLSVLDPALPGTPRLRWMLALFYFAWLRREEAAKLRMSAFHRVGDTWEIEVLGKGGKQARVMAPSPLIDELKAYRGWLGLPELPGARDNQPAIRSLVSQRGVSPDVLYREIKLHFARCAASAPDEGTRARFLRASPHWLRHTGVSHAMEAGVNPRRVQAQARHGSLATTGRYDHKDRQAWAGEMEQWAKTAT